MRCFQASNPCPLPPARFCSLQPQTNYLSHFLLSHELLAAQREHRRRRGWWGRPQAQEPLAQQPHQQHTAAQYHAGTRVVLLSSLTHHAGPAQWHDRLSRAGYSPFTSYALSKLCNTMTAFELQRRIDR
jgi:NAD(P)-dependent dehydrogenase (short-subunit alcohol dehydrogenase family)